MDRSSHWKPKIQIKTLLVIKSAILMQSLTLSQNYIVLSGGLGSSAYLRTRLQSAFVSTESHPDLQILVSEEP